MGKQTDFLIKQKNVVILINDVKLFGGRHKIISCFAFSEEFVVDI